MRMHSIRSILLVLGSIFGLAILIGVVSGVPFPTVFVRAVVATVVLLVALLMAYAIMRHFLPSFWKNIRLTATRTASHDQHQRVGQKVNIVVDEESHTSPPLQPDTSTSTASHIRVADKDSHSTASTNTHNSSSVSNLSSTSQSNSKSSPEKPTNVTTRGKSASKNMRRMSVAAYSDPKAVAEVVREMIHQSIFYGDLT